MGSRIFVVIGAVDLLALGWRGFVGFGVGRLLRDGAAWIVDCSRWVIGCRGIGAFGSVLVHLAFGRLCQADLSAKGGIYFDYVEVCVCNVGVVFPALIAG